MKKIFKFLKDMAWPVIRPIIFSLLKRKVCDEDDSAGAEDAPDAEGKKVDSTK